MALNKETLLDVLEAVQPLFQEGSAENELERYFVRTSFFEAVHADRADLVLGVKGSGKTAMFNEILNDPGASLKRRGIIVIPAFNLSADTIFKKLSKWKDDPEETLRQRWRIYLLALVGNQLVDAELGKEVTRDIENMLGVLDLRVKADEDVGIRQRILGLVRREELFPADPDDWDDDIEDFVDGLERDVTRGLRALEKVAWVAFDRLDEAFALKSAPFERAALRSLVQVTKDFNALALGRADPRPALRVKLFMRHDLYEKITHDAPLPNLEKLRRQELGWTDDLLGQVVVRRMLAVDAFCKAFRWNVDAGSTKRGRDEVLDRIFPAPVPDELPGSQDERLLGRSWQWTLEYLQDGTKQVVPRTVIEFLKAALFFEWDRISGEAEIDQATLLTGYSMQLAYEQISKDRLNDYIFNEDKECKRSGHKLAKGPALFSTELELAEWLGFGGQGGSPTNAAFYHTLDRFRSMGLVMQVAAGAYAVAPLYRPALDIQTRTDEPVRGMAGRPVSSQTKVDSGSANVASANANRAKGTPAKAGGAKTGSRKASAVKGGPTNGTTKASAVPANPLTTDAPGPWLRETISFLQPLAEGTRERMTLGELGGYLRDRGGGKSPTELLPFATLLAFVVDALDGSQFAVVRLEGGHPAISLGKHLPSGTKPERLTIGSRIHTTDSYRLELGRALSRLPDDVADLRRLVATLQGAKDVAVQDFNDADLNDAVRFLKQARFITYGAQQDDPTKRRVWINDEWRHVDLDVVRNGVVDICETRLRRRMGHVQRSVVEALFAGMRSPSSVDGAGTS